LLKSSSDVHTHKGEIKHTNVEKKRRKKTEGQTDDERLEYISCLVVFRD
jgi:hypothetical protein